MKDVEEGGRGGKIEQEGGKSQNTRRRRCPGCSVQCPHLMCLSHGPTLLQPGGTQPQLQHSPMTLLSPTPQHSASLGLNSPHSVAFRFFLLLSLIVVRFVRTCQGDRGGKMGHDGVFFWFGVFFFLFGVHANCPNFVPLK